MRSIGCQTNTRHGKVLHITQCMKCSFDLYSHREDKENWVCIKLMSIRKTKITNTTNMWPQEVPWLLLWPQQHLEEECYSVHIVLFSSEHLEHTCGSARTNQLRINLSLLSRCKDKLKNICNETDIIQIKPDRQLFPEVPLFPAHHTELLQSAKS